QRRAVVVMTLTNRIDRPVFPVTDKLRQSLSSATAGVCVNWTLQNFLSIRIGEPVRSCEATRGRAMIADRSGAPPLRCRLIRWHYSTLIGIKDVDEPANIPALGIAVPRPQVGVIVRSDCRGADDVEHFGFPDIGREPGFHRRIVPAKVLRILQERELLRRY